MPLSHPSWSSHHTKSSPKPKTKKTKPLDVYQQDMSRDTKIKRSTSLRTDSLSREGSAAGKKRPREDDKEMPSSPSRRTRSVGADKEGRDKEAFQRQLIGVFVPRALKESAEGSMGNYNDLVAHFLPSPLSPSSGTPLAPVLPLLRALTAHVSLIRPDLHSALITAILSLPWATADDRFVKTYVGWAGVLVSAHPGFAKEVVGMAVKGFRWQPTFPGDSSLTRRMYHARHHFLLAHLLSLIPTLPTVLQQVLTKNAPHKRDTEVAQSTWVRNCCEMIEYCPELGARVWSGLVDKMLRIDVEITNRVEDDDDDETEDEDEDDERLEESDPFDLSISQDVPHDVEESEDEDEDDDDADPDIDALSTDDELESETEAILDEAKLAELRKQKREVLKQLRGKLDAMLTHFLRHLEECMGGRERCVSAAELGAQMNAAVISASASSSSGSTPRGSRPATPTTGTAMPLRPPPTPAQSLAHFQTLLNLFSRQILPTSSTQHLPFTIFLCASFTPAHTELFLHLLVLQALYARTSDAPTFTSQPVPLAQRVAATVYIGSLVCRARFVSDDQARTVTQYLLAYVEGKLAQARDTPISSLDELPLFYAVCQAVFLIFCFRWRAFRGATVEDCVTGEMEMDDLGAEENAPEGEWMRDLDTLQRALTSDLNPLLGCNPTIVNMFAKTAHVTGFAYCFSIIEANQAAARNASTTSLRETQPSVASTNSKRTPSGGGSRRPQKTLALTVPRSARQVNVDAGLDSYFPFDPYDLPRSGEYVDKHYRTWSEVAVGGEESSDEDDDDEDEDEEEQGEDEEMADSDDDHITPIRRIPRASAGYSEPRRRDLLRDRVLSTSLEGMSISPNVSAWP